MTFCSPVPEFAFGVSRRNEKKCLLSHSLTLKSKYWVHRKKGGELPRTRTLCTVGPLTLMGLTAVVPSNHLSPLQGEGSGRARRDKGGRRECTLFLRNGPFWCIARMLLQEDASGSCVQQKCKAYERKCPRALNRPNR